ncbi:MAG: glutathione S-transferase N-terminal domain-containing protein, partial [Myxococcales bacterium]|nr:glutathione S-transferase N-terminal domain-containing protein [Myxococcales bacterium]
MLQAVTTATTAQPTLVLCELARPPAPGLESYSPFCVKVHRALKAAGLAYTSRRAMTPAGHRDVNPQRQVPVLLIDGRPVADSTHILAALAALQPTPPWVAVDPAEHAEALLWEELADSSLNGFLVAARWADDRNWPTVRDTFFSAAPWPVRRIVAPQARRRIVAGLVARDIWRAGPDACWRRFQILLDALERRAPATGFWLGHNL